MKPFIRKFPLLSFLAIIFALFLMLFLRPTLVEASLGPTYLFPERLKTGLATDMVLLITPSTDWGAETNSREVRIYFHPGEVADTEWCRQDVAMTVAATNTAPVDLGTYDITTNLPGTLVGSCVRGSGAAGQDYIRITGVGTLTSSIGYGVRITADDAKFRLGTVGTKFITVQLLESGGKTESAVFGISILAEDRVTVSATVATAKTVSCSLTPTTVNMGPLYKGGAYVTGQQLALTTTASTGFYWAVYGQGNGTNAGLFNAGGPYLLSAVGATVNLLTGEGFGMVATTNLGTVATNFLATTPGTFGGLGSGYNNARLFLSSLTAPGGTVNSVVTLGARAGTSATDGSYTETLTYICGAYIDGT